MSVLLRQPHGFEGFLALLVQDKALHYSVADGPNRRASGGHLNSVTSPQVGGAMHDHEITGFDEIGGSTRMDSQLRVNSSKNRRN